MESREIILILSLALALVLAVAIVAALLVILYGRMVKRAELERDLEAAHIAAAHNDEIRSMYAAMQEYQHDLKHQFFLLEKLVDQGSREAGEAYLKKLEVPEWTNQYCVGNMAVDALIAAKAMHIRHKGIHFTFTAYPIEELPIRETEFCAILGNVLDNAIEAVERLEDVGKKEISLRFSRFRNMLYITCKNTADGSRVVRQGPLFLSSKRVNLPGRGIPSIRRIVDRANGLLAVEHSDDRFIVSITLPYLTANRE